MSWAVAAAGLIQLMLLLFTKWFEYKGEKKEERRVLRDEGLKAIKNRDAGALHLVFCGINRL